MEYLIHTYDGSDLLVSVLNAVAMIFQSDNTYLNPVGSIAMSIGGLYIGVQAIYKGDIGLIVKSWMIPSLIVIMILYGAKTTVWIKDDVQMSAPVKIDNIPFGISFFTSISTKVSHYLSNIVEETMLPASMHGSSHAGLLYGAKAAAKLRDIQIQDPILLNNTKEYMRQCYMKPYVMGNFGGLKSKAISSSNILEFLEQNPAKCFGIKPINKDGSTGVFLSCKDAGALIRIGLGAEVNNPGLITKFGAAIGFSSSKKEMIEQVNHRIKSMTSDVLVYLDQSQTEIHEWMKQSMVLNANREGYDDLREKVGHERVFPELVRMQATRGMYGQALGSIVGAEMAASMIPSSAQPVMLALVIMIFVVILPFAVLPGGWNYIITGIKLIIWVTSWPVFYTIIYCIMMIQLKAAIDAWGEPGLSLIGQGGFTELILQKYAAAAALISATPIISFAVVYGSAYALSNIAGSIASVVGASAIGAGMADGNLSLGQRSYNSLSKNQHNSSPTLTMGGGIIDDGEMRVQSTIEGGQIITEHQDTMAVNYKMAEMTTGQLSQNLSNAKSDMASLTDSETKTASLVSSQNIDVARSIASGKTIASNLSESDVKTLKHGFSMDKSTTNNTSSSDSNSTGENANFGAGIPGGFLTGVSGGVSVNASNNHEVRKDMSDSERQAFNTALEKVKSGAKTNSLTSTNQEDTRLNNSFSANLSKQEQIANSRAKTQQDIDSYTDQISYVQANSGTIDRNANDAVINAVMNRHPEIGSKEQAARWMRSHRAEADEIARPIINNYNPFTSGDAQSRIAHLNKNTPSVNNTKIATPGSLEDSFGKSMVAINKQALSKDATGNDIPLENTYKNAVNNSNLRYNKDTETLLYNSLNPEDLGKLKKLKEEEGKSAKTETDIKAKHNENLDSAALRVVEKIGNNTTAAIDLVTGTKKTKK